MSFARKPGKMEFKKYFLVSVSKNLKQSKNPVQLFGCRPVLSFHLVTLKKHPYDPNTIL